MSAPVGYQPFAITKFQTGQFQYFQPWQSPDDAFDPLVNAFVFRGQLQKRQGTTIYGNTGLLRYRNYDLIATGNGGASYGPSTLARIPIASGSFNISVITSAGLETFTDNGAGVLTGSLGDAGTIVYVTGVWTLTFSGGRTVANSIPITGNYIFTANTSGLIRPIMFLGEFIDEVTNDHKLIAIDTRRATVFNTSTKLFDPISSFSQVIFVGDGSTKTLLVTQFGWSNLAPYSLTVSDGNSPIQAIISDVPATATTGAFPASGNLLSSPINYSTGVMTINFSGAPAVGVIITLTGSLAGDYFTGSRANLFNSINWTASHLDSAHLYLTNNVDQVTLYDGTNLSRPAFPTSNNGGTTVPYHANNFVNDIKTTLDLKVFNNRLLFIRPNLVGNSSPEAQAIYASASRNPTNFVIDIPGNGNATSAPTGDWIISAAYLRDFLIIDFQDSTFVLKYTGLDTEPFQFVRINVTKSTNAPYGTVEYDTTTASMGAKGLCECDGVNKDRYDLSAIDLYQDIDEDNFGLCQARRFDLIQQTWMIYPSIANKSPTDGNCDKAIIYNWIEGTWSTHEINLTCLGSAKTFQDRTWNSFTGQTWNQLNFTWNNIINQNLVPWMLGGDASGFIYFLNQGDFDNSNSANKTIVYADILSKRWNPFVEQGQKARFGYIDFYYMVSRNALGNDVKLELNYYVNDSDDPTLTQNMTLDTPPILNTSNPKNQMNEQYYWKRMYCNLTGQFLRLRINSMLEDVTTQGQFTIAGVVFWARPAGRLTPGTII